LNPVSEKAQEKDAPFCLSDSMGFIVSHIAISWLLMFQYCNATVLWKCRRASIVHVFHFLLLLAGLGDQGRVLTHLLQDTPFGIVFGILSSQLPPPV